MKIITSRKGLTRSEIVLWILVLAFLLFFLFFVGGIREKIFSNISDLFNFLRFT